MSFVELTCLRRAGEDAVIENLMDTGEADREGYGLMRGLAVATVTDNRDSEGLGRVRVRVGHPEEGNAGYWARVAVPMAIADHGAFFLPEIGDQVLAGFVMGRPANPYVLGSLWPGEARPQEDNGGRQADTHQIRTRANSELRFSGGAQPSLDLKLGDGKHLKMDDQGITLEDGKGNQLKIDSTSGTLTVRSLGQLKLEAPTISVDASASLELRAGGTLTIKGALVEIN